MKVTVFAKRIRKQDGSNFTGYVSQLTHMDGTKQYVRVRFNQGVQLPAEFPAVIEVEKQHANLSKKVVTNQDGSTYARYTFWIAAWKPTGEKYVDHSLDDFQ